MEQDNQLLGDTDVEQGMKLREEQDHNEETKEQEDGAAREIQLDHLQRHQEEYCDSPGMTTLVTNISWPPEPAVKSNKLSSSNHHQEQKANCDICLDDNIIHRAELEHCFHSFCRECLSEHCKLSLRQYPILCPHHRCKKPIPTRQVQELLSSQTLFDDHLKQYWLVQSNNYHECPVCSVLLTGGGETDIICANCKEISCRIHGRMHTGVSCREFQTTERARSWEDTEQTLQQWTKPCSHCGASLQKASGCDHVVCVSCQQDMCWKCGTHEYLTGTMIRHCAKCNRDYRDHRHDRSYRLRLCFVFPILIPFMLLYIVVAAALCILTGCFVCCFQCGQCLQPGIVEGNEARRVKFGWTHGVGATLFLLLLPVIALLEDCGVHIAIIDVLFPELSGEETEIPTWQSPASSDDEATV